MTMTSSERALVPGSSGGLPAHIEQRTRIANRVLGELERRDTEAFFRWHPEFFRLVVSRYYRLDEELIDRYEDFLDWEELSSNTALLWNEAFIERFSDQWDWNKLSENEELPWSEGFIFQFADYLNWWTISSSSHAALLLYSELDDYYFTFGMFTYELNLYRLSGCDLYMIH
jgi:hypothetical protein